MTLARTLPAFLFFLACLAAPTVNAAVYQCKDSSGRRVGWADRPQQCPSGSTAEAYEPPDLCVIPGVCEVGRPPTGAQPLEFLCCAFVSGDAACIHVATAFACPPDEFLASCEWGVTEANGDVTCYD